MHEQDMEMMRTANAYEIAAGVMGALAGTLDERSDHAAAFRSWSTRLGDQADRVRREAAGVPAVLSAGL